MQVQDAIMHETNDKPPHATNNVYLELLLQP